MGVSQNHGYLFGDPNNKDYSILGSILGPRITAKSGWITTGASPSPDVRATLQVAACALGILITSTFGDACNPD